MRTVCLLLICSCLSAYSQDQPAAQNEKAPSPGLSFRLSDQDILLPITSVEWGTPDRWSFTSRYVHEFDVSRQPMARRDNLTVSLSPATAGLRLGLGYQGIFNPLSGQSFLSFLEVRAVVMRTWSQPLYALPHSTYVGAEVRCTFFTIFNIGAGYYGLLEDPGGSQKPFIGFHVGIGI